ncbi:MAG TPA: hypothetical protein DEA89_03870 [Candidatus Moranbacteria bacterium]|nr:hypothetical protein [Candidatus Moranbacteria bacterium]HBI50323.1 hypothetical protein [Candidatus Moranbacteria bacterium]HBU11026.1 hypothetical protein [Candidatus Moranbacteria bacterium]HCO99037.1 hypothetical protein [Candidatus Moranbacteria bacterium]
MKLFAAHLVGVLFDIKLLLKKEFGICEVKFFDITSFKFNKELRIFWIILVYSFLIKIKQCISEMY